jgi:hypothetical protein
LLCTFQALLQILAFHVLLHHEVAYAFLKVIGYIGDQGMINMSQCGYLAFEITYFFLLFLRVGLLREQFFNHDEFAIEAHILC